ncbi:solute carrier family 22 member 7-like [Dermacentor andersoni]|uniref:solute carrier family 22 member 7-like n=1 Tax=Dermacentor andersoni TaxID=34620 RepID=UPI002155E4E5|nr:solute carrier family 22 member 7-like [Dermacentor andersoni]
MAKKKRQKSFSTTADATSKSARTNAVDRTAGTTGASGKDSRGRSTVYSPLTSQGRPDARPSTAHPETVGAPPSDPRVDSSHSSARRLRKAKNKKPKAPSALAEEAPARITSATETAAPGTVDTAVGAKDAGSMNTHRSSAFTALSPPSKLGTSHSVLGQPDVVGSTTSASHVTSSVTPLDHVLVFGHGKFQWVILFCTQLAVFCTVVHAVAMVSLAKPVDHWCRPPAGYGNLPPEVWKNSSIPVQEDGSYSRCFRYEPPFAPYDAGVNLSSTVPCDAGWDYAASIHTSIIAEWDLVCHRRWILLAMTASYMGSTVVVMPVAGVAADRVGRVPVLAVALFVLIVAGTTLAFATTLVMFTILRVLISVSVGSLLIAAVVLLFEVTDSSRRVLYCSIAIAGGVSTANVYGEIVYDLADRWVLVQMMNMLPSALLIGAVCIVQESPNWLLATHRVRRLCKMAISAAQTNGANLEHAAKRLEGFRKEDRRSRSESLSEGFNEASPLEVLTNPSFRSATLVAYGCWFLAMSLFDQLRGSRDALPVYYVQIALECPTVTANIFLLERKGRRIATAICMIALGFLVAALGAFCFILPDPSGDYGLARHLETTVRVTALLAVDSVVVSLCVITVEMYPTVLRVGGLAFAYVSGRFGAIAATFASSGSRLGRGVELTLLSLLLVAFGALALVVMPETTKIHATNTSPVVDARSAERDKWMLDGPLRLARDRRASSLVHTQRKSWAVSPS